MIKDVSDVFWLFWLFAEKSGGESDRAPLSRATNRSTRKRTNLPVDHTRVAV
jgi:hypothetical protein